MVVVDHEKCITDFEIGFADSNHDALFEFLNMTGNICFPNRTTTIFCPRNEESPDNILICGCYKKSDVGITQYKSRCT